MPNPVRAWLAPQPPTSVGTDIPQVTELPQRRTVGAELLIVFAITFGMSGLRSLLDLVNALLTAKPLNEQQVAINVSRSAISLLDLLYQLTNVAVLVAWAALGGYLLLRSGIKLASVGLDGSRIGTDLVGGVGLAAGIGIPGLAFYLATRALGLNLTVLPSTLTDTWWRVPELLLAATANALAEETLVVGYLITRLRQLGWRENSSLVTSAVLRGSYHLYQGFGGFAGNLVMGLVFGRVWQRTNRLLPLVVAHTILDIVSFVGYALLAKHISWL